MNDPVFFEAARAMAFRLMREPASDFHGRLNDAYRIALARWPTDHEAQAMQNYFNQTVHDLEQNPNTVTSLFPNRIDGVPLKFTR